MANKPEKSAAEIVLTLLLSFVINLFMFLVYANMWGVPHLHGM